VVRFEALIAPDLEAGRTCGTHGVLIERLGDKLTTNFPVMPERINHAPQSPVVFPPTGKTSDAPAFSALRKTASGSGTVKIMRGEESPEHGNFSPQSLGGGSVGGPNGFRSSVPMLDRFLVVCS
jgi:hypothetical protein